MKLERCEKESFSVIGKEGSSLDGVGFIQDSILRGLNVMMRQKLPMVGQSGLFPVMSTFMWNVKVRILVQRQ